jgi:hypothetical protein
MGLSEKSIDRAKRIFPVLVYYASVVQRTLTYGDLAKLTNDHHRPLKFAFELIHDWIEKVAPTLGIEKLPLAIIVVNQDSAVPGPGAIRWRLEHHGLPLDSPPPVIAALFHLEQQIIFDFPHWKLLLDPLGLKAYVPPKTDIGKVTQAIEAADYSAGESKAHLDLKNFVSMHPESVGLSRRARLVGTEVFLPSDDRMDILFEDANRLIVIEVKPDFVDESEFTRGIYQCVKYAALLKAREVDLGSQRAIESRMACSRAPTTSESVRSELLQIECYHVKMTA